MKKSHLKILEAAFAAEVRAALPYQSKVKAIAELAELGMIEPMERIFGGRFPVRVKGWQLTHLGRLTYCATC